MRTDDPVILRRLEQIEAACAGLRMACGFPPLVELPETTASRAPRWCPIANCSRGHTSLTDMQDHLRIDHGLSYAEAKGLIA